ncbi:MAG: J domain-containing protein [Spirochaetales bacterium]
MTMQKAAKTLGLSGVVTAASARKAYRKQVMEWHPDALASRGSSSTKNAELKIRTINAAWEFLEPLLAEAGPAGIQFGNETRKAKPRYKPSTKRYDEATRAEQEARREEAAARARQEAAKKHEEALRSQKEARREQSDARLRKAKTWARRRAKSLLTFAGGLPALCIYLVLVFEGEVNLFYTVSLLLPALVDFVFGFLLWSAESEPTSTS